MDKFANITAREAIAAAKLAATAKNTRASLRYVHVASDGRALIVEATDGFKLARFSHAAEGRAFSALFPAEDVRKAFRASDVLAVVEDGGALLLASEHARVAAVEGVNYPNCSQILDAPVKVEGRGLAAFDARFMADVCQAFEASEAARGGARLAMLADGVRPIRFSAAKGGDAFAAVLMPLRPGKDEAEAWPLAWSDAAKAADCRTAWARLPEGEKRRAMREERRRVAEEEAQAAPAAPIDPKPEPMPEPKETAPQKAAEPPKACMAETAAPKPKACAAETPEKSPKERAAAAPGKMAAEALAKSLGLAIRETSLCLWASGDTKPHAAELKGAGFKWSAKKSAWYWRKEVAA